MSRRTFRTGLAFAVGLCAALLIEVAGSAAAATSNSGKSAINGVYRLTWTEKQLIAAGMSADYARNNHATLTMTFRDGQFRFQIKEEPSLHCRGGYNLYTLNGTKRFSISFNDPVKCPEINGSLAAIWSRPNGNLKLNILSNRGEPGDEVIFGGKTWTKIG